MTIRQTQRQETFEPDQQRDGRFRFNTGSQDTGEWLPAFLDGQLYWPGARSTGTLTIGCNASAVYCKSDQAPIVPASLELPTDVDLNDYVGAVTRCIDRYAFSCQRIVIFEGEPKSQNDAHAHDYLIHSVRLLARARGIEMVSLNEINIDTMDVTSLPEDWVRSIEAYTIESLRRIALGRNDSFGRIVEPFDRKRFNSRTAFYELLHAAIRMQLHWPEYETYREENKGLPMWLRSQA